MSGNCRFRSRYERVRASAIGFLRNNDHSLHNFDNGEHNNQHDHHHNDNDPADNNVDNNNDDDDAANDHHCADNDSVSMFVNG